MRIVGGRLRGRALRTPSSDAIRPTSDRLRETLFDVLAHRYGDPVAGGRVVDLFAGTGALGLEALSRGASHTLFVEDGAEARALIRDNVEALGVAGLCRIFRRDATRLGDVQAAPFDLAFLDPPYGQGLGEAALTGLHQGRWLVPGALCVLEEAAASPIVAPEGFSIIERREAGIAQLVFLRAA
ncbi:MAG: 16S rRNA (guanine(966)-N(2))-methyltransferase RsmD [Janthinobacterium lividum]